MDRPDESRTNDLFEQIPGYLDPPVIPFRYPDASDLLKHLGVKDTNLNRRIIEFGLTASGFKHFQKTLRNDQLESLLRSVNLRLPGPLTPAFSTTAALQDDPRGLSPYQRAATLIFGAYSLYHSLRCAELKPIHYQDHPGEIGLYPNLFSTCVIVEGRGPRLFKGVFEPQITLLIGGRLFLLHLRDLQTEAWVEGLAAAIEKLAGQVSPLTSNEISPGLLTAADTKTQQHIFSQLAKDPIDAPILRRLRRSFITVCLDLEMAPSSLEEAARFAHSTNFTNRWFHSSCQIIVFGNGQACTNMNYLAHLDGEVMLHCAAEIQQRAAVYPLRSDAAESAGNGYRIDELDWDIIPKTIPPKLYQRAQDEIYGLVDQQPATFELPGLGRTFFDKLGINSDAGFVLALLATLRKLTGLSPSIIRQISLSGYRCMDEVSVQVVTDEGLRYLDVLSGMEESGVHSEQIFNRFQAAEVAHLECLIKAQRQIPPALLIELFINSRTDRQRIRAQMALQIIFSSIRISGIDEYHPQPDILISNLTLYPQAPLVGRPGLRLPTVNSFGMYYQIWPDRIVTTITPGIDWKLPNQVLVKEIEKSIANYSELKK